MRMLNLKTTYLYIVICRVQNQVQNPVQALSIPLDITYSNPKGSSSPADASPHPTPPVPTIGESQV